MELTGQLDLEDYLGHSSESTFGRTSIVVALMWFVVLVNFAGGEFFGVAIVDSIF